MMPMPPRKPTPHKRPKTPRRIHTSTTIPKPRKRAAKTQGPKRHTNQERTQRRTNDLFLSRVQSNTKRHKQQCKTKPELDDKGVGYGDFVGEQPAAAGFEVPGPVGGAHEEAGDGAAGCLEGDVEDHSR